MMAMSRNTLESSMIETAVTVDDASLAVPPCFADDMVAADVARGVGRLFYRHGLVMLCEVPLPNGRRADLLAMDARGEIVIVFDVVEQVSNIVSKRELQKAGVSL